MAHGLQSNPLPGKWYKIAIDWPEDAVVCWTRNLPCLSPPYKATWSLGTSRFFHNTLTYGPNWYLCDSWKLYDGP